MAVDRIALGWANLHQGDLGECWLEVVAAASGLSHGRPATQDIQKSDIQLTMSGVVAGYYDPTVQVQVKTAVGLVPNSDDTLSFELDVDTYNALRQRRTVKRVLMVVVLPREADRVRIEPEGTLLVGLSAWVSLEGEPETRNVATITVRVPLANRVDPSGLVDMLTRYGTPSSTRVPSVDPWGVA